MGEVGLPPRPDESQPPEERKGPLGSGLLRPRKGFGEAVASTLAWILGFAWTVAAWAAVGGASSYPFMEQPPCGDAVRDVALDSRLTQSAIAIVILVVGGSLASVGVRALQPRVAGTRALWVSGVLLAGSPIPIIGGFIGMGLPYALGLSVRAGRERQPVLRWIVVLSTCVVTAVASAFWYDAMECL